MKFVALLRGINVGGRNIIKMTDLKACFEENGFENVSTYIQSGNVIFSSPEKSTGELEDRIEKALSTTFKYDAKVLVRSSQQIQQILLKAPPTWKNGSDLRCYITFIKEPATPQAAMQEVELKEDIDFIEAGQGVLYMSTLFSGLSKSKFSKLIGKKIYRDMTMRNYATTQKIGALME